MSLLISDFKLMSERYYLVCSTETIDVKDMEGNPTTLCAEKFIAEQSTMICQLKMKTERLKQAIAYSDPTLTRQPVTP